VLIVVFTLNMVGIVLFSIFRMNRLRQCYQYLNYVHELAMNINFEELQMMKTYLSSVGTIATTSGKNESKNKEKELDQMQINKENERLQKMDTNKKQMAKRRLRSIITIEFPFTRVLLANFVLFLLLLGANFIVLTVSHVFDKDFENLIILEEKIVQGFAYEQFALNYIFVQDTIRKTRALRNYYQFTPEEILSMIEKNLNNEPLNEVFEMNSVFAQQYLDLMNSQDLCKSLQQNNSATVDQAASCRSINSGILTKGKLA
jgi:hypothetical protein